MEKNVLNSSYTQYITLRFSGFQLKRNNYEQFFFLSIILVRKVGEEEKKNVVVDTRHKTKERIIRGGQRSKIEYFSNSFPFEMDTFQFLYFGIQDNNKRKIKKIKREMKGE